MRIEFQDEAISPKLLWAGRIFTALVALFMLVDGVMKLFKPSFVIEATTKLGYAESVIIPLGIVLTISTIIYLFPRTEVLGAILLTGYLGGAVATHVRVGAGWFEILFPVIFGAMAWGGIHLRDRQLQSLIPITSQNRVNASKMVWVGYFLSALVSLLLIFSAYMKFAKPAGFAENFAQFGYSISTATGLGIVEISCLILYLFPRTAVLGAILMAGYLGGATATHLRVGDVFVMPFIAGVIAWGGLFLRDERIRALIPIRK